MKFALENKGKTFWGHFWVICPSSRHFFGGPPGKHQEDFSKKLTYYLTSASGLQSKRETWHFLPISLRRNESRPAGFTHKESRRAGFIFGDYCICAEDVRTGPERWIRTQAVVRTGTSKMARDWTLEPKIQTQVDIQFGPKMAKVSNVFNGHHTLGLGTSSLPCIDYVWDFPEKFPNGSHLDKNFQKLTETRSTLIDAYLGLKSSFLACCSPLNSPRCPLTPATK